MNSVDVAIAGPAALRLAVPRDKPADSFVLHAGLELIARVGLLPLVHPDRRADARRQILRLADEYDAWGAAVPEPGDATFDSLEEAAAALIVAIDVGDLDEVDRVSRWLGETANPTELRTLLAGPLVNRLGAAAHAPIFLYLLPCIAPNGELTGAMLRGLARDLAREAGWRLHWVDAVAPGCTGAASRPPGAMFDALASTPSNPVEGATPFIYPTMARVDEDDTAACVPGPVLEGGVVGAMGYEVLRAAAWSMLLESDEHTPYGWTHALTLPQAVLGIADATPDPRRALAIAATYVVGFRAALAREPLAPAAPDDPGVSLDAGLAIDRRTAAGCVWHLADVDRQNLVTELATRASLHHDAHYVKYTLACLTAAADDCEHGRLYLSAAGALAGWWAKVDRDVAPSGVVDA